MNKKTIIIKCRFCGKNTEIFDYRESYYIKKGGGYCVECKSKKSSEVLKKLRATQSPEEKSKAAKYARSKVKPENMSAGVKKQWKGFRNNPSKYKEICDAKSKRMEKVWEGYSDEQRNFIVKSLCDANGCGRSKVSEKFKQELIKYNLYDGFKSEDVFHGFVPDEINHELKIIIEIFGDLYHCNPKVYKNENVFINAIQRTVGEQWKRDRIKLASYYRNGYTTIVVWEDDIYKKLPEQIERVRNEITKKRNLTGVL
jgi:G:T-mismatch repair DNA endonuclease (very short patch repair protein)